MTKCICGCGYNLSGQQKKYSSKQCQNRYERGALHMTKPKKHPYLGEMLTVREAMEKYGCEVQAESVYGRMKLKGMTMYEAITHPKSSREKERPKHITEYCLQGWDECSEYSECSGKKYTGSCFVKEPKTSGVQGISNICTINL